MTQGDHDGVCSVSSTLSSLSLSSLSLSPTPTPTPIGSYPRLPLEVLEYIISLLAPDAVAGDPVTQRTLVRLSGVSRLVRHWSFQALFTVLVLPRHVRDFRKWYARMRSAMPPFSFAGYTRGLFCALDDISRLTTFSAGWDNEMLRMLHYAGPSLTYLSLWRSESTALLRDPGQVRAAHRLGKQQAPWSWGSGGLIELDSDLATTPSSSTDATQPTSRDGALYTPQELSEMPNWLRAEIASSDPQDVTKRHKAHLVPTLPPPSRLNGCRPRYISIMLSLPLYEHEDPALFAMMSIWSRVEELDIYVPTPAQVDKCLRLVVSLHRSPVRWLRVSTCHASLVLLKAPFPRSERRQEEATSMSRRDRSHHTTHPSPPAGEAEINIIKILSDFLARDHLNATLINEFTGHHLGDCETLERVFLQAVQLRTGLEQQELERSFRITFSQDNQQKWGKFKDRLGDFAQRVEGRGDGAWEVLS